MAVLAFAAHAELDERDPERVPEIVPLEIHMTRAFRTPETDFPMLSEDGSEAAVLYGGLYFNGDRSISLDIIGVADNHLRHRYLLQQPHEDFAEGSVDGYMWRERVTRANVHLAEKGFEPMRPFFRLAFDPPPSDWPVACYQRRRCEFQPQAPGDPGRLPATTLSEGRQIRFDYQTGILTIGGARESGASYAGRNELILHWPVVEPRSAREDPARYCDAQAAPREAWIAGPRDGDDKWVVLIRISYLVDDLACTQPDEWQVELLPR